MLLWNKRLLGAKIIIMLYEVLTRTYLWLYWFVNYNSFLEYECGTLQKVDGEDLLNWLGDVVLDIHDFDYSYSRYEEF